MQRTRLALLVALALPVFIAAPGSASAYEAIGYDPDDRPVVHADPDIRSSWRGVTSGHAGRVLTLGIRAFERLGTFEDRFDYWYLNFRVDSRLGPNHDYRVRMAVDGDGLRCSLLPASDHPGRAGRFNIVRTRTTCRLPMHLFHPDKRIRWNIISPSGWTVGIRENAPNGGGWYR